MSPWIHQAKTRMVELVDGVQQEHPNTRIRVGFIGYRDYGDTVPLIEIPFQNAHETMAEIQPIQADGGDDIAEDIANGLFRALHMDWSESDVKIVFHIADAPAHGTMFHGIRISDRYPRGDPNGLDPRDSVEKMSFLDINFTFVKINDSTDTMIDQFHNAYAHGGSFSVIDLRPQTRYTRMDALDLGPRVGAMESDPTILSEALTRSVTQSIAQHYTTLPAS